VSIQDNVDNVNDTLDGSNPSFVTQIPTNVENTQNVASNLESNPMRFRPNAFNSKVIQSQVDELTKLSSKVDRNAYPSWSIDCPRSVEERRQQTVSRGIPTSDTTGVSPETNAHEVKPYGENMPPETSTRTHQIKPNLKNKSSKKRECDKDMQLAIHNFQKPVLPPLISEEPKHREYCTIGVRASSFSGFPTSSRKTPKELAIGGFFFRGFGDRTTCFQCGISLQGWRAEDDVFVEHVRNNPLCQYMRRLKGDDFVKLVMSVTQNQQVLVRHLNLFFSFKMFIPSKSREDPGKNRSSASPCVS
jgi:hypothetical protein